MGECRAFVCATRGCQATIHLHHDVEERLRRTHETFYCPAGHSNYFPGKTNEEKRIAQLERRAEQWQERYEEALEERDDWKLLAKTCPFGCGYRVLRKYKPESIAATLVFHLIEEHGADWPVLADTAREGEALPSTASAES